MKQAHRFLAALLACMAVLTACSSGGPETTGTTTVPETTVAPTEPLEVKDYASSVKLNMASETAKKEVTV